MYFYHTVSAEVSISRTLIMFLHFIETKSECLIFIKTFVVFYEPEAILVSIASPDITSWYCRAAYFSVLDYFVLRSRL